MKLLIIEDDQHLSDTIRDMTAVNYEVEQAFDGEEGLYLAQMNIYDAIILDIMLPNMNGYQVLGELRKHQVFTPVLILTAKDGLDDKIQGFKQGADDYLVKPFHREELLLRLEAITRRTGTGGVVEPQTLTFKELWLHLHHKTVSIEDEILQISGKQFELLEYLIRNRNMILTKEQIFNRIWGFESETSTTVVEVYASHLRKHLKKFGYDRYLKTYRGLGYMLTDVGDSHV